MDSPRFSDFPDPSDGDELSTIARPTGGPLGDSDVATGLPTISEPKWSIQDYLRESAEVQHVHAPEHDALYDVDFTQRHEETSEWGLYGAASSIEYARELLGAPLISDSVGVENSGLSGTTEEVLERAVVSKLDSWSVSELHELGLESDSSKIDLGATSRDVELPLSADESGLVRDRILGSLAGLSAEVDGGPGDYWPGSHGQANDAATLRFNGEVGEALSLFGGAWASSIAGKEVALRFAIRQVFRAYLVAHGVPDFLASPLAKFATDAALGDASERDRKRESVVVLGERLIRLGV